METVTREHVEASAVALRAEAARLEARAREVEALGRPRPAVRSTPAQQAVRAAARRRRRRRTQWQRFVRGLSRVVRAVAVGVVAGVLLYLLALSSVVKLIDDRGAPASVVDAP